MSRLLAALALVAVVAPVWAASRTVTLAVPGMNCAACPLTVKLALSKVAGVKRTEIDFANRRALVTFDDRQSSVEALRRASANAGYPASLEE